MVINYDNALQEDKDYARLLLNQLNTASGTYYLKKEITFFLENMNEKYGNIPKITLEQELINLKNEYNKYKTKPYKGYAKLDGMRYSNINERVCHDYEMRIQELERKIKSLPKS